ncbi:MAG: YfiR family protein [Chryseolinea sp.]
MKKFFLVSALLLITQLGFSQNYKLHSVYMYSFTRYILWPDAYNQGDFEIMVLGDAPILEELKAMAQAKKVGDRPIKITKISNPADIRKCNMLFVPTSKSGKIDEVLLKVGTQSILVISEEAGLGAKGSNINFIVKDGKLVFELNQGAINKQNLKVSSELSRLAILI